MKINKGTDVIELSTCGEKFLVKAKGKSGRAIIEALESIVGSPALEDFPETDYEGDPITISRYRLSHDVKLVDD